MNKNLHTDSSKTYAAWPWWLVLLYIQFLLLALFFVMTVSVRQESLGAATLSYGKPIIDWIVATGRGLTQNPAYRALLLAKISFALLGLLAIYALISRRTLGIRPALILLAFATAILAQTAFFLKSVHWGTVGYTVAGVLILLWRFLPSTLGEGIELVEKHDEFQHRTLSNTRPRTFVILEALGLCLMTLAVIFYRFYALNQLPLFFDGEIIASSLVSTDLQSTFTLNYSGLSKLGWAPLGLIYYLLCNAMINLFGSSLLSIRMVSAVVGVMLVPLFYGILRRSMGVTVAFVGTFLFAFSPMEIVWGRHDFFPLSYPTLIVLAMCWTTYLSMTRKNWYYFFLTAIFMGLLYHVFPSGQPVVILPFVLFFYLLVDREFRRCCWWKLSLILLGAGFWLLGLSLNHYLATGNWQWLYPFSQAALTKGTLRNQVLITSIPDSSFGERASILIEQLWNNFNGLIQSMYIQNQWEFARYTPLHGIPDHPLTYLSGFAAIFLFVGLMIFLLTPFKRNSLFFLAWIAAGILPGMLSSMAEARRVATAFPAFIAVSAIGFYFLFQIVQNLTGFRGMKYIRNAIIMIVLFVIAVMQGSFYFKERSSTPGAVATANAIRPYLSHNALVITDFHIDDPYRIPNELTLLLLDDLRRDYKPPAWHLTDENAWPFIAIDPQVNYSHWYYQHSVLRHHIQRLKNQGKWNDVVFIVQASPENQWKIELLQQIYPSAYHSFEIPYPSEPQHNFFVLRIPYDETLQDLKNPTLIIRGEDESLPKEPTLFWDRVHLNILHDTNAQPNKGVKLTYLAGMLITNQIWLQFQINGGGENPILYVNRQPVTADEPLLLTQGMHEIQIEVENPTQFPMRVHALTYGNSSEILLNSENLVSHELCEIPMWKPQTLLNYSGFQEPIDLLNLDPAYMASMDISPSGHLAVLKKSPEELDIKILHQNRIINEFMYKKAEVSDNKHHVITFLNDDVLAILDAPQVILIKTDGEIIRRVNLPLLNHETMDMDANTSGQIFLTSVHNHVVYVISLENEEIQTITPRSEVSARIWMPRLVSSSQRDSVAVFDNQGNLYRFQKEGEDGRVWKQVYLKENVNQAQLDFNSISMTSDPDNWIYINFSLQGGYMCFDQDLQRRVAHPKQDLSLLLPEHITSPIGTDREGNLYVLNAGRNSASLLIPFNTPVEHPPVSSEN